MIILDCEQHSTEWFKGRSAIPTASMFSKIITSTGKPSTSATGYMNQLLAEFLVGGPVDQIEQNHWMERGSDMEAQARQAYSLVSDTDVQEVGFVFRDESRMTGCSPDGLIGDDGVWECKCPKASTMVEYMLGGKLPSKYVPQVQGQLWVTGRQWTDFFAYHPDLPPFRIRVERDAEYCKLLEIAIYKFITQMGKKREELSK